MKTKEDFKQEFINERTRIISEMLDNPDKYGIYPTTKCFNAIDELWDKLSESYAKQHAIKFLEHCFPYSKIKTRIGQPSHEQLYTEFNPPK